MEKIWNNKDLLTKAAITSDTNSFTGGVGLSKEEADRFIDYIIDESRLKDRVDIIRTDKKDKDIDELKLDDEDVILPGVAAVDPGDSVGVNTVRRQLNMKEGVAIARISDDALEDGIEGDAFADHVMKVVSKAVANQLVKTLLLGRIDDEAPTKFIQSWDGWLEIAKDSGQVIDASTFADRFVDRDKLSAILKTMPNKYMEANQDPSFMMARHIGQDWRDTFADRETNQGDAAVTGANLPSYGGVPATVFNQFPVIDPFLVSGGQSTTVDGDQVAGTTNFVVAASAGWIVGDVFTINRGGSKEESHTVTAVPDGTHLTIASPGVTFAIEDGFTVEEVTLDGSRTLLAEFKNLIWGIQRDIRIETDRLPRLRSTDWVISFKMDAQVRNPDALVLMENLKSRPV
ncbi:hypothetical protein LCGC14_0929240 [marine sediment metagenome]|uniref:Major capsid protein n=1 Tax=marine sediment metagenome TaxID=412755 RepID=A0A0F9NT35_9ZZZZ